MDATRLGELVVQGGMLQPVVIGGEACHETAPHLVVHNDPTLTKYTFEFTIRLKEGARITGQELASIAGAAGSPPTVATLSWFARSEGHHRIVMGLIDRQKPGSERRLLITNRASYKGLARAAAVEQRSVQPARAVAQEHRPAISPLLQKLMDRAK